MYFHFKNTHRRVLTFIFLSVWNKNLLSSNCWLVATDQTFLSLLHRLWMQNRPPAIMVLLLLLSKFFELSFMCVYGLSYLVTQNTIVFLKNWSKLTQTCCLFSISNFIFMLKHLKVSWKVCLRVFSIRTLWKAPTILPHRNTTALESSYRKREPEVRGEMKIHLYRFF